MNRTSCAYVLLIMGLQGCATNVVDSAGHGQRVRQATQGQVLPQQERAGSGMLAQELQPALSQYLRGAQASTRNEAGPAPDAAKAQP